MEFISTRGRDSVSNSYEAILKGIADDGGLFVPRVIPQINIEELENMDYLSLAEVIIGTIFDDIPKDDLKYAVKEAYGRFEEEILTIEDVDNLHFLELYHGPTAAFKDFALCLLPQLMQLALKAKGIDKNIVILTATSGDTGKAALEGFKDVNGIDVIVFYPTDGVSEIQKYQMITQEGENTYALGIHGNFDDAQSALKEIFLDSEFKDLLNQKDYLLSSANSINIGRLVPQIVYYVYSYLYLVKSKAITMGEKINISVPTGNFGNILAAYIAKKLGTPIDKFVCASNENDVLTDFFNTGKYNANRELKVTNSPSMDIIVSSNLERLLYFISDGDYKMINSLMDQLKTDKYYSLPDYMNKAMRDFYSYSIDEEKSVELIREVYENHDYLIDTHTAVGYGAAKEFLEDIKSKNHLIIATTASPYKFPKSVGEALGIDNESEFDLIEDIEEKTHAQIPSKLKDLNTRPITQDSIIDKSDIKHSIAKILKVGA